MLAESTCHDRCNMIEKQKSRRETKKIQKIVSREKITFVSYLRNVFGEVYHAKMQ